MATSIRHRLEQAEALIEEKLANYEKEMGSLKGELKRGRREAHKAKTELEKGNTPKNLALLKGKKSFLKMKLEAVENAHAEVLGAKDKLIALYNEEVHGVAGLRAPRVTARDAGQRRSRWPARVGAGRIRLSTEGGVACRDAALRYPLLWKSRFAMGAVMASLSMMSIMSLLLYYNLYAQSQEGIGLTALEAGASLLPLCVALLALAISASSTAARVGLRATIMVGMVLVVIGSATLGVATVMGGFVVLAIGFFVLGAGLALPYATAPQLALSALSRTQAGQGSGMVNACTFLGGSIGVAGGAIAFAWGGFVAVLAMLTLVGLLGVTLSRWIPQAA